MIFNGDYINLSVLKNRAYNLRWATVPEDVIPLTAADPDFQCSPTIITAVEAYSREGYFSYAPPEGLPEFKQAMHDFYNSSEKKVLMRNRKLKFNWDHAAMRYIEIYNKTLGQ